MNHTFRPLTCALLAASSFVIAAVWSQEPARILPPPTDAGEFAQGKPDPKDKKKPDDKEKKPPDVAVAKPPPLPEARLDYIPRTLPRAPEMLGDQPPSRVPGGGIRVPGGGGGGGGAADAPIFLPGPRGFKVSENGSPRPQDRIYFGFQVYSDLHGDLNRANGANVGNISLFRETFGFEKTFLGGAASIEMRLPLDTLQVTGTAALNGNHTALGDLSIVLRYALLRDWERDNFFTVGLAVTAPTGPSTVGRIDAPSGNHSTVLQPFVGYLYYRGEGYLQGFSAIDVPADRRDVTFWYNDVSLGYFLYRTPDSSRFLTGFAPAFEIHVANPLNYRDTGTFFDEVNLGAVANFEFYNAARLSAGVVTPVTGPRPFNVEGIVQLRLRY